MNKPVTNLTPEAEICGCRRCGFSGPVRLFKADTRNASGFSSYCKSCHSAASRSWQAANPERVKAARRARYAAKRDALNSQRRDGYDATGARSRARLYRYGVSDSFYAQMLRAQDGCCAICRRPAVAFKRPLSVDHDHACCPKAPTCGKCTRGLLCGPCNLTIHSFDARPDWVGSALRYLEIHK